jgi:hypothetical protein
VSERRGTPYNGRPALVVEVVWGDITQAEGDVHLAGHYVGVLPQNAEWQLDKAISSREGQKPGRLLISELTKRGALRGDLGEVVFFPWTRNRIVAVAGMGGLGTFGEEQLRAMARSVATTIGLLPERTTFTSVLRGGGPVPSTLGTRCRWRAGISFKSKQQYGSTWGAYQHYGDPTRFLYPDQQGRGGRRRRAGSTPNP